MHDLKVTPIPYKVNIFPKPPLSQHNITKTIKFDKFRLVTASVGTNRIKLPILGNPWIRQESALTSECYTALWSLHTIHTRVSSRHSQQFELDGLQQKQKLSWYSRVENQLFSSRNHIFRPFF